MSEITPISIGDVVYCADYDDDWREDCWINGLVVTALVDDGDRAEAHGGPEGYSHRIFGLRHAGERNRDISESPEARC